MEGEQRALRCCTDRQESRSSHGAHTLLHCCDRNNLKERSITAYGFGGGCVGGNLCKSCLHFARSGARGCCARITGGYSFQSPSRLILLIRHSLKVLQPPPYRATSWGRGVQTYRPKGNISASPVPPFLGRNFCLESSTLVLILCPEALVNHFPDCG